MSCMTHYCTVCGEEWFNNELAGSCPKCSSVEVSSICDEDIDEDIARTMEPEDDEDDTREA